MSKYKRYFAEQLVRKETLWNEINEKYDREQAEWESARSTLEKRCSDVEDVSEKRRLDLLVDQAKLM